LFTIPLIRNLIAVLMGKLAKREEQLMQALWLLKKAFVKDIVAALPDPKPHYNSVATMIRILEQKGVAGHESLGGTFRYYPVLSREEYLSQTFSDLVRAYFNGSYAHMLAFLARERNFSKQDMDDLLDHMKSQDF
jgi:BlaI family penicillinase repressor